MAALISVAGSVNGEYGFVDGPADVARFNKPHGLAFDPTHTYLYVADFGNRAIRRVEVATGNVETITELPAVNGDTNRPTYVCVPDLASNVLWPGYAQDPDLGDHIIVTSRGINGGAVWKIRISDGEVITMSALSLNAEPAAAGEIAFRGYGMAEVKGDGYTDSYPCIDYMVKFPLGTLPGGATQFGFFTSGWWHLRNTISGWFRRSAGGEAEWMFNESVAAGGELRVPYEQPEVEMSGEDPPVCGPDEAASLAPEVHVHDGAYPGDAGFVRVVNDEGDHFYVCMRDYVYPSNDGIVAVGGQWGGAYWHCAFPEEKEPIPKTGHLDSADQIHNWWSNPLPPPGSLVVDSELEPYESARQCAIGPEVDGYSTIISPLSYNADGIIQLVKFDIDAPSPSHDTHPFIECQHLDYGSLRNRPLAGIQFDNDTFRAYFTTNHGWLALNQASGVVNGTPLNSVIYLEPDRPGFETQKTAAHHAGYYTLGTAAGARTDGLRQMQLRRLRTGSIHDGFAPAPVPAAAGSLDHITRLSWSTVLSPDQPITLPFELEVDDLVVFAFAAAGGMDDVEIGYEGVEWIYRSPWLDKAFTAYSAEHVYDMPTTVTTSERTVMAVVVYRGAFAEDGWRVTANASTGFDRADGTGVPGFDYESSNDGRAIALRAFTYNGPTRTGYLWPGTDPVEEVTNRSLQMPGEAFGVFVTQENLLQPPVSSVEFNPTEILEEGAGWLMVLWNELLMPLTGGQGMPGRIPIR